MSLPDHENCIRIGKELQLCGEANTANEIVTRRDAAMLLHAILTRAFTVETPPAPVALVNAAGVNINDFLLALRQVPEPVLAAFNAAGWTYRIDFDYISELSKQLNMSCIGATNYSQKPSTSRMPARHFMSSDISSIGRWESPQSMSSYILQKRRTPGCGITPKPTPENTSRTALTTGSHTAAAKNAWKPFGMPRRRLGPTLRRWRKTTGAADIAYYFRSRGELRRSLCIRAAQQAINSSGVGIAPAHGISETIPASLGCAMRMARLISLRTSSTLIPSRTAMTSIKR